MWYIQNGVYFTFYNIALLILLNYLDYREYQQKLLVIFSQFYLMPQYIWHEHFQVISFSKGMFLKNLD